MVVIKYTASALFLVLFVKATIMLFTGETEGGFVIFVFLAFGLFVAYALSLAAKPINPKN